MRLISGKMTFVLYQRTPHFARVYCLDVGRVSSLVRFPDALRSVTAGRAARAPRSLQPCELLAHQDELPSPADAPRYTTCSRSPWTRETTIREPPCVLLSLPCARELRAYVLLALPPSARTDVVSGRTVRLTGDLSTPAQTRAVPSPQRAPASRREAPPPYPVPQLSAQAER